MNLAQVFHQRWAADETLDGLLPASRVYTGVSVDPTTPYAVVTRQSDRPLARLGDGSTVDRIGMQVQVFHHNYDAGAAVVDRLKAAFHLAELALAGGDKVLSIQRSNDFEGQDNDGLWQFTVDFECTVFLASGV